MTKTNTAIAILAGLCLAMAGCGSKEEGGGDKAAKPSGKSKAPAKWQTIKLDKMGGLSIEVPGGAEVMDSSADAPNVMISSAECTIMVSTVTPMYPSTFEAAKKSVESDPNKFQKFTVEKQTEDGWHLEFELKSMMDDSPLYGVSIRKKIGDKAFECARNDRDKAKVACVAKACLTLAK